MRAAIFSFSRRGALLSLRAGAFLRGLGWEVRAETIGKYAASTGLAPMLPDHHAACARAFADCGAVIFISAAGIAVRTVAPLVRSKLSDPAVLVMDEGGNFIIPLLSGHIGGANELARSLARALGGTACVTTATDVHGLFAVDEWAARHRMVLGSLSAAKEFAAALVNGEKAGVYSDFPLRGPLPAGTEAADGQKQFRTGMAVTLDKSLHPFPVTVLLLPKILHLGIGCRKNTPLAALEALILPQLAQLQLDMRAVAGIASIDLKKNEPGLLEFAGKYGLPARFYSAEELLSAPGEFASSAFVHSVTGVDNVCERSAVLASGGGRLLLGKVSLNGVTLAVAAEKITLDFTETGLKTDEGW